MEITTITTAAMEAAEAAGRNSRLVESKNELSRKKFKDGKSRGRRSR